MRKLTTEEENAIHELIRELDPELFALCGKENAQALAECIFTDEPWEQIWQRHHGNTNGAADATPLRQL